MENAAQPAAPPPAPAAAPSPRLAAESAPTRVKRSLESGVAGRPLKVARTDAAGRVGALHTPPGGGANRAMAAEGAGGAARPGVALDGRPRAGGEVQALVAARAARTGADDDDAKLGDGGGGGGGGVVAGGGGGGFYAGGDAAGKLAADGGGAAVVKAAKAEPEIAAVVRVGVSGKGGGLGTSGAGMGGEGDGRAAVGADVGKGLRFEEGTVVVEAGKDGRGGGETSKAVGDDGGGEWAPLPEGDEADDDEEEMEGEADLDLAGMRQHEAEQVAKFNADQLQRYECYRRSDLKTAKVKRVLTALNPALVKASDQLVVAVKGLAKVFVGDVVETALEVRHECGETGPLQPKHLHEAYRRMESKGGIPSTSARHNSLS